MMKQIACYGRWQGVHVGADRVDGVQFTGPTGMAYHRPVFRHQPVALSYDEHGYESITCIDRPVWAVRFTPDRPGEWRYAWIGPRHAFG